MEIVKIKVVKSTNIQVFERELEETVKSLQGEGLEVKIEYAPVKSEMGMIFTALVILCKVGETYEDRFIRKLIENDKHEI